MARPGVGRTGRRLDPAWHIIEFNVSGTAVRGVHVEERLTLADGAQGHPDLRVTADASTILGLAAGELTVSEARPTLELEPDTPEASATLERFLSPAPGDAS